MDAMNVKHRILMFPWLAQGHIAPLLELGRKLIKRNFVVYICTSEVNINAFKPGTLQEASSQQIQFVELPLPSLPELPPINHTTKGLPPHLISTLYNALCMAKDDFRGILETIKPDLVIYDYFQPWAPQLASSLNIPAVFFMSSSAALLYYFTFLVKKQGEAFPFPEICPRAKISPRKNVQQPESAPDVNMPGPFESIDRSCDVILINSFNDVEAKYIESVSGLLNKKVIPVGPLVHCLPNGDDDKTIEWIDKKEQASVLYVSFGSECYLTNEEIQAIAEGLELSNVNFIWVIRFPEGSEIRLEEALPEGFLKRVGERGLVLGSWAPQTRILAHPSTGGFLSHCGWNSLLESMYFGVPVVAFPMHLDQPVNARLVEENGFGMEVGRDENGKCQGGELARVIRDVVVEKNGETVRERARELKDFMRQKSEEDKDIDEAVKELVQLRVNN